MSVTLSCNQNGYPIQWDSSILGTGDAASIFSASHAEASYFQAPTSAPPLIQPLSSAGVDVQNLANASHQAGQSFFDRVSAQSPMAFLAAAFPIVMAVNTLVELVKDFCTFIKACFLGLGQDISEYVQNIIIHVLKLGSSLLAPLKFFMDIFNFGSPLLLFAASIVSGVFSVVCFVWQIVRDSIGLFHTQSALHVIDQMMQNEELSTAEKTARILQYFEEAKLLREAENARVLENVPDFRQESAEQFLDEHTTLQMEKMFGKQTYERIQKGIECLHAASDRPEEMLKAIECVREIRERLVSRSINNWINIAACVCAIAAVIFSIAFPGAGVGLTVVTVVIYGLWAIAVSGWAANGINAYLAYSSCNDLQMDEERIASREPRTVNCQGQICGLATATSDNPYLDEIELLINEVNARIFEDDNPEERRRKIEKILLSSEELYQYQKLLVKKLKEEMFIPFNDILDHLMDLIEHGRPNDALGVADQWRDEGGRTWRELIEKIKIIKSINSSFAGLALRKEWVSTLNAENDLTPLCV